jgi:DNA-binding CsgD family transcriptional regulator
VVRHRPPLTIGDVAVRLRISYDAVRSLMDDPDDPLPSYELTDRSVRIDAVEYDRWVARRFVYPRSSVVPTLTNRERVVLAAAAVSVSDRAAGQVLGISAETVREHVRIVTAKYRGAGHTISSRHDLFRIAARHGYVTLPDAPPADAGNPAAPRS